MGDRAEEEYERTETDDISLQKRFNLDLSSFHSGAGMDWGRYGLTGGVFRPEAESGE
jgi:hypothetical protein